MSSLLPPAVAAPRPNTTGAAAPLSLSSGMAMAGTADNGPTTKGRATDGSPSRAGFVIVTLPGASRPLDSAVFHVLALDDLRRVRDDHGPTPAGSLAGFDASDASPASLDDAVTAAHSRRVALLNDRIVALCATDGASSQLAALRDRLRRAEAAWRLAAARTGGRTPHDDTPAYEGPGGCRLRPMSIVSAGGTAPPRATVRVTLARHAAGPVSPGARRHGPGIFFAARMAQRRSPAYRASVRVAEATRERHQAPGHRAADLADAASVRLAQARRSLARARQALTGDTAPSATLISPPARPAMVFASLWRWEGSERWRLSPAAR